MKSYLNAVETEFLSKEDKKRIKNSEHPLFYKEYLKTEITIRVFHE